MVIVTGFYTILGGLKAVIYTDTIQMFLLLGGSILVTIFGLNEIVALDYYKCLEMASAESW